MEKKFVGLIVDDDSVIREGLKNSLNVVNEIQLLVEASNGQEALNKIRKQEFDFLVVDLVMPKMGGIDFLKQAFKEERIIKQKTKVIVLTGNLDKEIFDEMMPMGIKNFVVKPCDIETITQKINSVLGIG